MLNIQVYKRNLIIYSLPKKSFHVHRKAVLMQAAITGDNTIISTCTFCYIFNTKICLTHELLFEFKMCVKNIRLIGTRYFIFFFIFVSTNFQSKTQVRFKHIMFTLYFICLLRLSIDDQRIQISLTQNLYYIGYIKYLNISSIRIFCLITFP